MLNLGWARIRKFFVDKPVALYGATALAAGAIMLAATTAEPAPTARPAARPTTHVVTPVHPLPPLRLATGNVHGSIYADFKGRRVLVTDFPVFLKTLAGAVSGATVTTDRFGRYYVRDHINGDYHLCWSAPGWVAGCAANLIQIRGNISYLASQRVVPAAPSLAAGPAGAVMWGRVTLADGSSPYFNNPYFAVKQDVKVVIHSGATVIATVFTNTAGEFVVPFVPFSAGPVQVTATAGGGTVTIVAAAGQGNPLTLKINDKRPSIQGIATQLAGKERHEVPAGSALGVKAEVKDPDGHAVTITWKPGPDNGTMSSTSGTTSTWTVPGRPGIMALYALADDRHGGISMASAGVSVGATQAYFGVSLIDSDTKTRVTNATVTVNGIAAALLPKGMFFAKAPISDRYVVNVTAPGYIFVSRIYDHGGVFHEVQLVHPTLGTADPTKDIVLIDTRKNLREQGYVESAPAQIRIKAGTLVGPDKKRATGTLSAEIGAINVSSEQFPGDNGALVGGRDVGLISYGAMHVELRDGAGNRMQLASGQTADIVIPVPFQMKNPPATLAVWYYNEQNGFWEPLPKKAIYDPGKRAYVGQVTHLSAFNIDLDQADLSCFRVMLDNIQNGQLQMRITPNTGQTFPDSGWFDIHDQLNVVKRLPPLSNVHVFVRQNGGSGDGLLLLDGDQIVHGTNGTGDFDTGPASLPHFPAAPYTNCLTLSVRTGVTPPDGLSTVSFLSLYSGEGDQPTTQDYYLHLDSAMSHPAADYVGGTHATLGAWWGLAGFNLPGAPGHPNTAADEHRRGYLNFNDLGFGRDMHIRRTGTTAFAFVTNFNDGVVPTQNPINAVYAENQLADKVVATVAMEATDFPDGGGGTMHKVVKFWVYGGNQAGSKLLDAADLDGFGPKFVPQLCQVCHGGKPYAGPSASNINYALRTSAGALGASFREFDLASFVFPGDTAPGNVAGLSATDMTSFFNLNQDVLFSGAQPALADLINGFNPNNTTFHSDWVPAGTGWDDGATKQDLYVNVVGKSCRTCHIAFDASATIAGHPPNTLNWQDYPTFAAQKPTIGFAVCSDSKYMPHALMTFRNFWLGVLGGPYEPPKLASFNHAPEWTPALGTCK